MSVWWKAYRAGTLVSLSAIFCWGRWESGSIGMAAGQDGGTAKINLNPTQICDQMPLPRDGKFLKWPPVPSPPVLVYGRTWHPVQVLSTGPYYAWVVKIGPPVRYRSQIFEDWCELPVLYCRSSPSLPLPVLCSRPWAKPMCEHGTRLRFSRNCI